MNISFNKYKFFSILLQVAIFFLLEYAYKHFVAPLYEYEHFLYEYNSLKYIETKLLFFFVLLVINFKNPSPFIYAVNQIFFLFMFSPNLIVYEYNPATPRLIIYSIAVFLILLHILGFIRVKVKTVKLTEKQFVILILFLIVLMLIPIVAYYKFNLNLKVLEFKDVYKVRLENRPPNALIAYSYTWLSKILLPVLLAYSIIRKKYGLSIFAIVLLLYLYLTQAHKSVFFSTLLIIYFYFFKNYYKKIFFFLFLLFVAIITVHFLYVFMGKLMPESLLVRRVLFLPAVINKLYFSAFKDQPLFLSHSVFSSFFHYPYQLDPPHLIGKIFFHSPQTNVNNGFISDGYMNFGSLGVWIYVVLVAITIKFFDLFYIDSRYYGIFFYIIFTLISSYFLTSLMTHGILILMLLALFFLRDYQKIEL